MIIIDGKSGLQWSKVTYREHVDTVFAMGRLAVHERREGERREERKEEKATNGRPYGIGTKQPGKQKERALEQEGNKVKRRRKEERIGKSYSGSKHKHQSTYGYASVPFFCILHSNGREEMKDIVNEFCLKRERGL